MKHFALWTATIAYLSGLTHVAYEASKDFWHQGLLRIVALTFKPALQQQGHVANTCIGLPFGLQQNMSHDTAHPELPFIGLIAFVCVYTEACIATLMEIA